MQALAKFRTNAPPNCRCEHANPPKACEQLDERVLARKHTILAHITYAVQYPGSDSMCSCADPAARLGVLDRTPPLSACSDARQD
jgi:hypothetical protein